MASRQLTSAFVALVIVVFPAALFAQWIPYDATGTIPIHYTGDTQVYGSFFLGGPTAPYGALYLWPDTSGSSIHGTGSGIELRAASGTIWLHSGNTLIEGWDSTPATNTALTVKGSTSTGANGALNVMSSSGTSIMYVRNDGSVGIGTQNPGTRFTVAGYSNNGSARISVDRPAPDRESSILFRTGNDPASQWAIGKMATTPTTESLSFTYGTNSPSVVVDPNGNVALSGTPNPAIRLDAYGAAAVYGSARRVARFLDTTAVAEGVGAGVDFLGKYNSGGVYTQFANVKGVKANGTDGDLTGNFVISINDSNGNINEVVRVTPTTMTVAGTLTATQVIGATYQDVAEWVPASEEMRAGTVVVVDPNADNGVMPSSHAYDTGVAGVISAQPGVILGVAGPSKTKVATTGRVLVHVNATRGPIRAGDLLVTSDKPGLAMRSEPIDLNGQKIHRPGTIVGKALQPLASGEGQILVLLSLQ